MIHILGQNFNTLTPPWYILGLGPCYPKPIKVLKLGLLYLGCILGIGFNLKKYSTSIIPENPTCTYPRQDLIYELL